MFLKQPKTGKTRRSQPRKNKESTLELGNGRIYHQRIAKPKISKSKTRPIIGVPNM